MLSWRLLVVGFDRFDRFERKVWGGGNGLIYEDEDDDHGSWLL